MTTLRIGPVFNGEEASVNASVSITLVFADGSSAIGFVLNTFVTEYRSVALLDDSIECELVPQTQIATPNAVATYYRVSIETRKASALYTIQVPESATPLELYDLVGAAELPPGSIVPAGLSAYEVAVDEGFVGTIEEWLTSLMGPQGEQGAQGDPGVDGVVGADGASAYEVAVAEGFVGDEAAWLASLIGPPDLNSHVPVTVSGDFNYFTLSGQELIRLQVDLGTHVTGNLDGGVFT